MNLSTPSAAGILYIVATPIGNLEDVTLRSLRILKEVDLIAAEDTRHTRKLLNHYDIHTPLISYYREKELSRADELIARLRQGENIALVSDAGTPAISDPGAILVAEAHQAGLTVCPIPGASALTAAVSVAGLTQGSFLFVGFAPNRSAQRRKLLTSLIACEYPMAFYEAPRRIAAFLSDALAILGDRQALWTRELTKTFEEVMCRPLSSLVEHCREGETRGEFVIVIWPSSAPVAEGENIEELLIWYRDHSGLSLKDASKQLAADLGLSRSQVYQLALSLWKS